MCSAPRNFVPEPYPYHHEFDLVVERLTNLGQGVCRDAGWVVMVPFVLPGERIRARVFRNHKNFSEADLLEVLEPSPERVEPRCPLFGDCGGCQYQHQDYASQLAWKRRHVVDALQRIGGLRPEVEPTQGSPEPYGYRAKLTPHYEKVRRDADPSDPGQWPIGFLREGRRSLVDVPQCPIATPAVNQALPEARKMLQERAHWLKRGGTLLLRETDQGVLTDPRATAFQTVSGLTFRHQAGEFFQNNPIILPLLVEHVRSEAASSGARYLVDAYCGVGVFALTCADRFEAVAGVELGERAVQFARENARANGIANVSFHAASAEAVFGEIVWPGGETAVVVDPPRRGCDEVFLRQLFAFNPRTVVYVSCDPATQARDARLISEAGYAIARVLPFDLFPQTRHIENVITFVREPGR